MKFASKKDKFLCSCLGKSTPIYAFNEYPRFSSIFAELYSPKAA